MPTGSTHRTSVESLERGAGISPAPATAVVIIGGGILYRIALAFRMPVGYDEIFDLSLGLLRMRDTAAGLWVVAPIEKAAALAPLWWWVQWIPVRLTGELSLAAIRIIPVTLALAMLPMAWFAARRRRVYGDFTPRASFDRRTAFVFLALIAWSDIVAFTCSRGEFAEPLLLLFLIPCVARVGSLDRGIARGGLWCGLLLTHLGKGMFAVGLNVFAELVIIALTRRHFARRMRALLLSGGIAIFAVGIWLIAVQVHYSNRPIPHAVGTFESVTSLVRAITLEYPKYKEHVTGSVRDALQIWLDARAWPLSVLSTPILAYAAIVVLVDVFRRARARLPLNSRQLKIVGLLVWSLAGVALVALRGTAGARFHLAYLPALWLLAANILATTRAANYPRFIALSLIASIWFGLGFGWSSWTDLEMNFSRAALTAGLVAASAAAVLSLGCSINWQPRLSAVWAAAVIALPAAILAGPLAWAPAAENGAEPMYGSKAQRALDAAEAPWRVVYAEPSANLHVYLSHYFLTQKDLQSAEHFARRAILRDDYDKIAWFYLGLILDAQSRPLDERLAVWKKAADLSPESARIRDRLTELTRKAKEVPPKPDLNGRSPP